MKKFLKDMYGVGIIFFYYMKWLIVIGVALLYFGLDYKFNIIMAILWLFSLALIIKDFIYLVVLKKKY
jgi:accessory gene regulator protein AgrB